MKKTKYLNRAEFNNLMDEFDRNHTPYNIYDYSCSVTVETRQNIYMASLTEDEDDIVNIGALANSFYKLFPDLRHKYGYKEHKTNLDKTKVTWDYKVAHGYQYFDEYYARKPLKCWGYDINSAFPYAMLQPMPDTTATPRYNDVVGKNEIGFYKGGGATTVVGEWAEIIFPLIESPFKDYVMKLYKEKKESDGLAREKYKRKLNYVTGLLARRNIFLRNAVIYYSNRYIKKYVDDATVYCNVDCIVSLVPRPDIPLGEEIGQFKKEFECANFKYIQSGIYQIEDECHYTGIPRGLLTDIEDISDWTSRVPYKLENGRIVKNDRHRRCN